MAEKTAKKLGCGHNAIVGQVISACFEMNIPPERVIKVSGIGCSSKAPTYFMKRSFGFNGLHGRMPSLVTGALFADTSLIGIGVSGGLTKGQFSATAEKGLALKKQGQNRYVPVDIVWEAIAGRASFVARTFSGDPQQLKALIKAGLHHRGIAVIDVISPCVTFNNQDDSYHSYAWGKSHEVALHELSFVPPVKAIKVKYEKGETLEVPLFDGTHIILKKLAHDYEPTDRVRALQMLEDANRKNELVTGLIYINPKQISLFDLYDLPDMPLNRLPIEKLRPSPESLEEINQQMF